MSWFNWVCPCAPARLVSMLPWGLLGAEGLHCLLSPPPRLQRWERACSQLPAGAEDSRLFTGSLSGLGLTLHDPAWGACLLHLFVKTGHPTSRNKDNQRKQARVRLLCSHVYSACTCKVALFPCLLCVHRRGFSIALSILKKTCRPESIGSLPWFCWQPGAPR